MDILNFCTIIIACFTIMLHQRNIKKEITDYLLALMDLKDESVLSKAMKHADDIVSPVQHRMNNMGNHFHRIRQELMKKEGIDIPEYKPKFKGDE